MRNLLALSYFLGLLSALAGLFWLRRQMVPSRLTATPEVPCKCTSKSLSSQESLAKQAMSSVRLDYTPSSTEVPLGDGCGLREMLDGRGMTFPNSCTSLTGSQEAALRRKTPPQLRRAFYNSSRSTSTARATTDGYSTPTTPARTSLTDTSFIGC